MFKLTFYAPSNSVLAIKEALFSAGAGRQGYYSNCAWETKGKGQFMPLDGAEPNIGVIGQMSIVDEVKVEMVVSEDAIDAALAALKLSHPYESPAYEVYRLDRWGQ